MGYKVEIISQQEKDELMERHHSKDLYELKAIIHGTCVKLFTDSEDFKEMWEDNFDLVPDWLRPHARVFAISDSVDGLSVKYEPISKTVIIRGCDYYGWVKSIALGLVADFFEDFTSEHRRYSVHGSFIDVQGRGTAIIGPSGSGKTTLTYGLLLSEECNFMTDDWFFVRMASNEVLVHSAEKNSYIRGDLAESWPQFRKKLEGIRKDRQDRAIVDVRRLFGGDRIRMHSTLTKTVLLARDKRLPTFSELKSAEAVDFMLRNDFCNPHQLVRTKEKLEKRKSFFAELFTRAPVYLLNTIETPRESLARLKKLMGVEG